MNKKLILTLLVVLALSCALLVACSPKEEPVYNVTFDAQNGTENTTVVFDSNFKMPDNPAKEGFEFVTWYTDAECTDGNEWDSTVALEADITVYAKWVQGVYTLTINYQNGKPSETIEVKGALTMPKNPTYGDNQFLGWSLDPDGEQMWTVPTYLTEDTVIYAAWHIHDFGDNYIIFVKCAKDGCNVIGRNACTDTAKENFVYNFDDDRQKEIDDLYDAILANLEAHEDEPALEELFERYDDEVNYIVEQYQYAQVFYSYKPRQYKAIFDRISEYYNTSVNRYYSVFGKVYEIEDYREQFYAGWTKEEIQRALDYAGSYGDEEYKKIKDEIDTLLSEYDEIKNKNSTTMDEFSRMYAKLVALNNRLAAHFGYDNFMEYAYKVKYERYYTPEQTAEMRGYVKEHIVPVLDSMMTRWTSIRSEVSKGFRTTGDELLYYGTMSESIFEGTKYEFFKYTREGCYYVGNYLKALNSDQFGQSIDFYQSANKLFEEGNYYVGAQAEAYSYWIPAQQTTILFFGDGYQNAFTFLHEFGHYYNNVYNKGLSSSMDLKETQSQGDEMLFLAWLKDHKKSTVTDFGFETISCLQVLNTLYTVAIATCVDEFEQAAYTGSYKGEALPVIEGTEDVDYAGLFSTIMQEYGSAMSGNDSYWSKVVFHSAGYYISYAMSALPSVEIYVKGATDFESAKASYFKLFAYSDNEELVAVDEDGNKYTTATYAEIVNYAGLHNPFQVELYTTIHNYFSGPTLD